MLSISHSVVEVLEQILASHSELLELANSVR